MEGKKKIEISLSGLILVIIVIILVMAIVILLQRNNEFTEKIAELEQNIIQLEEIQKNEDVVENEEMTDNEVENKITNQVSNTSNLKVTNTDNNHQSDKNVESNNSNVSTTNNNSNVSKENSLESKIIGNWSPVKAIENGQEVGLNRVYGSSISSRDYLTFNTDGTYTEFIGVYSSEIEDDLQGSYTVSDNLITLVTNNGTKKFVDYSNNMLMEEEGTYVVYFEKVK